MNVLKYQEFTQTTSMYPGAGDHGLEALIYCVIGLCNETGELAGKFKKVMRGDLPLHRVRDKAIDEMGDVLWYLTRMCVEMNVTLEDLAERNVDKLMNRLHHGTIRGGGDER